ncbi:MAG: HPr-rel-A system PqqD family peptide chaperone [Deltaproteobacteria bacterium]|nr:HPr-rel-A system PqqD family peptide chaperone [Deltaproteobacteria bacterium]
MYQHLALSDSGFLFDTRTGNTYTLNKTATWMLKALMAGTAEADLAKGLSEHFEVDEGTAQRDAEQFLFRLRDLHLRDAEARSDANQDSGRTAPGGM